MNIYKFNWNVVAHVCPEYKQYLRAYSVDSEREHEMNWRMSLKRVRMSGVDEEDNVISEMCDDTATARRSPELHEMEFHQYQDRSEYADKDGEHVDYDLKEEYQDPPMADSYNPLQLLPPKRFLDQGSYLDYLGETEYHIYHNKYKDHTRDLIKIKLSVDGDKIRLIYARYWFDQYRNLTSDRRGLFKCLVYNTKTRNLYFMSRVEHKNKITKSVRYSNKVRGILWSRSALQMALGCFGGRLTDKFVDLLERAVRRDVPDAFIPNIIDEYWPLINRMFSAIDNLQSHKILKVISLLVQHKVGCRLDWLQPGLIRNLDGLIYIRDFEAQITGNRELYESGQWEDSIKKIELELTNRVRKVIPTIRKYKSPKKLLKALCGKHYYNLLLKIVFLRIPIDESDWINLIVLRENYSLPKSLYHWLNELVKNVDENPEPLALLIQSLHRFRNMDADADFDFIDPWIKLNKRLVSEGEKIVNWDMWRDTCTMANDLHIRLRPNKFTNHDMVKDIHDKLSAIQRRDLRAKIEYENAVFEDFAIPDKEYEGFRFVQLKTTADLVHEGTTMHHCVGGYSKRCISGRSIIFSMRKGNRSYVTIELNGESYKINQQYTIHDNIVTSAKALEIINEWYEDVLELHGNDPVSYYKLQVQINAKKVIHKIRQLEEDLRRGVMNRTRNESDDFINMLEEAVGENYGAA